MLQDHEFFLSCNPHMQKFEAQGQVSEPELPESIKPQGPTTLYKVTDLVETLPKGIWGSSVESTYEFTDFELGTFCLLRSPLNVVMHTFWSIEEKNGGLELVEACEIKCSRLLIGIVKSLNEGGCEYLCPFLLDLWQGNGLDPHPCYVTSWINEHPFHADEYIRTGSKIHAKMMDRLKKELGEAPANGATA